MPICRRGCPSGVTEIGAPVVQALTSPEGLQMSPLFLCLDVRAEAQVQHCVEDVHQLLGLIDVLVNAAGVTSLGNITATRTAVQSSTSARSLASKGALANRAFLFWFRELGQLHIAAPAARSDAAERGRQGQGYVALRAVPQLRDESPPNTATLLCSIWVSSL
ncbi:MULTISPECIES: SDR family NAD(P)-dependent oxidoreductase [Pseudomonas]|uniref:SDR family NAD(P)-dependent oxidoreductase n=1 Tax=Pseudomonas TaxID=286 RepID=UPI0039E04476